MPKTIAPEQLDIICAILKRASEGLMPSEVARQFTPALEERTVRRWLDALVKQGRAESIPDGGEMRYRLRTAPSPAEPTPPSPVPLNELLREAIVTIVGGHLPRSAALLILQQYSFQRVQNPADRGGFVSNAMAVIDHLTAEQAGSFGLLPEQYEAWSRSYFVAEHPQAGPAPTASTGAPPQPSPHAMMDTSASPVTEPPSAASLPGPQPPPKSDPKPTAKLPPEPAHAPISRPSASASQHPQPPAIDLAAAVEALAPMINPSHPAPTRATPGMAAPTPGLNAIVKLLINWVERPGSGGGSSTMNVIKLVAGFTALMGVYQYAQRYSLLWFVPLGLVAGYWAYRNIQQRRTASAANTDAPTTSAAPRISRRAWWLMGGAGAAVLAIVFGMLWYRHAQQYPSKSAISEYLVASLRPLPVRVAAIEVTYGTPTLASCTLSYRALIEITEPLFRPTDASEYLHAHFPNEMYQIDAANKLLTGQDAARIRAALESTGIPSSGASDRSAVRTSGSPDSISAAQLSTLSALGASQGAAALSLFAVQSPPGTSDLTEGALTATKLGGIWTFKGDPVTINRTHIAGDLLPPGGGVFRVEYPDDQAQLKTLITNEAALAAKVQAVALSLPPASPSSAVSHPSSDSSGPVPSVASAKEGLLSASPAVAPTPPPYPSAIGAYILSDDHWVALPRNNGHPVQTAAEKAAMNKLIDQFDNGPDWKPGKSAEVIGHLVFDGRDSVPVVSSRDVMMVYVGPVKPLGEELLIAFPDLVNYPVIELAPASLTAAGSRSAPIYLLLPGLPSNSYSRK